MRGALETKPRFSQLADEIQQQGSHWIAVEMIYRDKYIFSFTGVLFYSINIGAISVYCVVKTGVYKLLSKSWKCVRFRKRLTSTEL